MQILLILQCLCAIWLNNYPYSSGSLWQFKRDEVTNNGDVTNDNNAPSFKYKLSIIDNTEAVGRKNGVKIAVPL